MKRKFVKILYLSLIIFGMVIPKIILKTPSIYFFIGLILGPGILFLISYFIGKKISKGNPDFIPTFTIQFSQMILLMIGYISILVKYYIFTNVQAVLFFISLILQIALLFILIHNKNKTVFTILLIINIFHLIVLIYQSITTNDVYLLASEILHIYLRVASIISMLIYYNYKKRTLSID